LKLESFTPEALRDACQQVMSNQSMADSAMALRRTLKAQGGAQRIVSVMSCR
jgi:UDP:flavonoid glycosyltransferase YjiC (YdhE family)